MDANSLGVHSRANSKNILVDELLFDDRPRYVTWYSADDHCILYVFSNLSTKFDNLI